jgi:putative CocE/NonD family hydrolase
MTTTDREAGAVRGVETVMADGTVLRATIHHSGTGEPGPVLLVRNPYGEPMSRNVPIAPFNVAGFTVVVQDCRGCGASEGEFVPFENEESDTLDSIEWCARQSWSNGHVSMYGASYSAMVQFAAAVNAPPALDAIIPIVAPNDYHGGVAYRGGAFQLGQLSGWFTLKSLQTLLHKRQHGEALGDLFSAFAQHAADPSRSTAHLPLNAAPLLSEVLGSWKSWLQAETRDEYWAALSYRDRRGAIAVPGLHVGGWFDLFLGGTLDNFATLSGNGKVGASQRLVVGPWSHTDQSGTVGELSFGAAASSLALGLEAVETQFAIAASRKEPIPGPPVRIFVMGTNVWRDEQEWPLARTEWTNWYLHDGGGLFPAPPTASEPPTIFIHDPSDPVPTCGGQTLMTGGADGGVEWMPGPRDQRAIEARADVLSFTSGFLDRDLEVTGPISVVLYASTSANDTDFVAKLVDVWPDGRAMVVVDGIIRARYRTGQHSASIVEPGEVYELTIDLFGTSQVFRAGHRLRVEISSSNYPCFDRNAGTGWLAGEAIAEDFVVAHQRVFHDKARPSHIRLPIIPFAG